MSEIASIKLASVKFNGDAVSFAISKPRKAQHSGPLQSFALTRNQDDSVCPVTAIRCYIDNTREKRKGGVEEHLFIGLIAPFKPVSTNTISRWIKDLLGQAGIDTDFLKAHSVRGAGTSKEVTKGVSMDAILRAGHWASESTFRRFYQRATESSEPVAVTILTS